MNYEKANKIVKEAFDKRMSDIMNTRNEQGVYNMRGHGICEAGESAEFYLKADGQFTEDALFELTSIGYDYQYTFVPEIKPLSDATSVDLENFVENGYNRLINAAKEEIGKIPRNQVAVFSFNCRVVRPSNESIHCTAVCYFVLYICEI